MNSEELERRAQSYEAEGLVVQRIHLHGDEGRLTRIRVKRPKRSMIDVAIEEELLKEDGQHNDH